MFNEAAICRDQAVIVRKGGAFEWFFKKRHEFVVPFVGNNAHQDTDNSLTAIDEPLRQVEALLAIDNKKGKVHGVCSAPDKSVELAWQLYDTV